jgi:hypothetical protein
MSLTIFLKPFSFFIECLMLFIVTHLMNNTKHIIFNSKVGPGKQTLFSLFYFLAICRYSITDEVI